MEKKKGTKTGKWEWFNQKILVKIFATLRKQLKNNVLKFSKTLMTCFHIADQLQFNHGTE